MKSGFSTQFSYISLAGRGRARKTSFATRNVLSLKSVIICFCGLFIIRCDGQDIPWLYYPVPPNPYYHPHSDLNYGAMSNVNFVRTVPVITQHRSSPVNGQWSTVQNRQPSSSTYDSSNTPQQQEYVQTRNPQEQDLEIQTRYPQNTGSSQQKPPQVVAVTSSNFRCKSENPFLETRYHAETNRCYLTGNRGPCGDKMIFEARNEVDGYCLCDQDKHVRPLVQIGNKCHLLYTQAICPQGYWLTPRKPTMEPTCQPNPCLNIQYFRIKYRVGEELTDMVPLNGQCVFLHDPHPCNRKDEEVIIPANSLEPACGINTNTRKRLYRRQISSVNQFSCGDGMRRHRITKKCISVVSRGIMFNQMG